MRALPAKKVWNWRRQQDELARQIFERHPQNVIARARRAHAYLHDRDIEKAEETLKPLMDRRRFHVAEFAAFCSTQLEVFEAKREMESARSWLEMWATADPDNPN